MVIPNDFRSRGLPGDQRSSLFELAGARRWPVPENLRDPPMQFGYHRFPSHLMGIWYPLAIEHSTGESSFSMGK